MPESADTLKNLDEKCANEEISEDIYYKRVDMLLRDVDITLKAAKIDRTSKEYNDMKGQAMTLSAQDSLYDLLKTFGVPGTDNLTTADAIRKSFAENIWVFMDRPQSKLPILPSYICEMAILLYIRTY